VETESLQKRHRDQIPDMGSVQSALYYLNGGW
jgi:hypothetical protein